MRNHYESEIGHFTNAIKPDVDTFRESLPIIETQLSEHKQDKKLLMYCTGGIRCEKASAYFKHKGFENVYQLEGGIIEYTRQVKAEGLKSKFIGKNFVFDHRLGERITDDIVSQCHQCGAHGGRIYPRRCGGDAFGRPSGAEALRPCRGAGSDCAR